MNSRSPCILSHEPGGLYLEQSMKVLFNILMTMPFGFMLRFLTGLWCLFPRAYRCFDVNDLTLGGVLVDLFKSHRKEDKHLYYEELLKIYNGSTIQDL